MELFIIYLASVVVFNYCGYFYYKLRFKHLRYDIMNVLMSLIPLLNTVWAVSFAIDYYKESHK